MRSCPQCARLFEDHVDLCPDDGAQLSAPDGFLGSVVEGKYRVEAALGSGAMGAVYRATQLALDRRVAIKIIRPALVADRDAAVRFKREALAVARLKHPHIITIHDFGTLEGGGAYIVMELVEGKSLNQELAERGPLPVDEALDITRQVCEAVEEAHDRGVIHRDLKPHNILLEPSREGPRAKVLDFGIAKLRGHEDHRSGSVTQSGILLGTPLYMSPEQCTGDEVDARSDVYSLGCVLYELLTGRTPFTARNIMQLLSRHAMERPAPPSKHVEGLPPAVDAVVLNALEKAPGARFQTAGDFAAALVWARQTSAGGGEPVVEGVTIRSPRSIRAKRDALPLMVGRERQVETVTACLERALEGEFQLALVGGAAGTGKSRLLDELELLASQRSVRLLRGRFAELEQALPYNGFLEVIHEYARSREEGGAQLADIAPELVALFPSLGEHEAFRGVRREARPVADRTAIHETLAAAISRMSGGRPLVICFEDLHAADVSVEALSYAARRLGGTPVLIAGSYRAEEVDRRHALRRLIDAFEGERGFAHLELGPLDAGDQKALVESLLEGGRVEETLVERLREAGEGNPYFTREIVRSLVEGGAIAPDATGRWGIASGAGPMADALPKSMRDVVLRRMARLDDEARLLLTTASVLGKRFQMADLELIAGGGEEIGELVDQLIEGGLLVEDRRARGDWLEFASPATREVLYGGSTRRKRRMLHQRFAEALEEREAGRVERVLPQLVHHYAMGEVAGKVIEHGLRLARASLQTWSGADARRAIEHVLEFVDEEDGAATEGEARELLAEASRLEGDQARRLEELEAAVRAWERARDRQRTLDAMALVAEAAWEGRKSDEARRWVERGLVESQSSADLRAPDSRRRLLSLGATIANLAGEYELARDYLSEVEAARATGEADEEAPRGGRLVVAGHRAVEARHPALVTLDFEAEVLANVFETLVVEDERGGLAPWLCERWEALDGARSFVFTMRGEARFHDGVRVTAEAVKESIETSVRLAAVALPPAFAAIRGVEAFLADEAAQVEGLEVRSERELAISLERPAPIYPALLTQTAAAVARVGGADEGFIGTGPFTVAEHAEGRVVLKRAPSYWGGSEARMDLVEFRHVPESAGRAAGLRTGEFDLTGELEEKDLEGLLEAGGVRLRLVEAPRRATTFLVFNERGRIAQCPGAARALAGLARRPELVRSAAGRFARPAEGLITPGMLGHDPGRRFRAPSLDEAVEALRASGLELPTRLVSCVLVGPRGRVAGLVEALFATWARVGVEVEVGTPTRESFAARQADADGMDLIVQNWAADYDDPDNFTRAQFHSDTGLLRAYYSARDLDAAMEEALEESNRGVRESLYRTIDGRLLATGLVAPLHHTVGYRVAGPRVRGLATSAAPPYVNYAGVGVTEVAEGALARSGARPRIEVAMSMAPSSLDPSLASHEVDAEVASLVFEPLLRVGEGMRIEPWLVSDMKVEEGGARYRFRLRDGVRFHDGRRVTSRDVRHSFERLLAGEGYYRWTFSPIKGADAVLRGETRELAGLSILSPAEFTIELERPLACFPAMLTDLAAAIVPEGTERIEGSWREGSVGTGPFRMTRYDLGRRIELEANPDYWRPGYPRCAGVAFEFEVPEDELLARALDGRAAVAWSVRTRTVEALRRDPKTAPGLRDCLMLATWFLAFNVRRGPLGDEATRRRLVAAIDVERLVSEVYGQGAVPARTLIPPGLLGYEPGWRAGARAAEAPAGEEVELTCAMPPAMLATLGPALENMLAERGFGLRVVTETWEEYEAAFQSGAVDLCSVPWECDYPDPDSMVHGVLHSEAGYFGRFVGSPELDRLCELGRSEPSPEARRRVYGEIEETIARRALLLPLYHTKFFCHVGPGVEGAKLNVFFPRISYEKLRVL